MSSYNILHDWALRLRNPLAGLNTTPQTWSGRVVHVSRHYPHLLCWSWFIERRDEPWPKRFYFYRHGAGGHMGFGRWHFFWQNYRIRRHG